MSFEKFQYIISRLIGTERGRPGLSGLPIGDQMGPAGDGSTFTARNLNAAFLLVLSGPAHSQYLEAFDLVNDALNHPEHTGLAEFLQEGLFLVEEEIRKRILEDRSFADDLDSLVIWLIENDNPPVWEAMTRFHRLWFPEGADLRADREKEVRELRRRRTVSVTTLNAEPLSSIYQQVLFTANALLTVPLEGVDLDSLPLPDTIRESLREVQGQDQRFWYDHPIPIGVEYRRNEAVYGLRSLEEAMRFEVRRGNMPSGERLTCLVSVSTTHEGLKAISRQYLELELGRGGKFRHLDVHVATEEDTRELLEKVLVPAARQYLGKRKTEALEEVFGVDGNYGRHYTFLKAAGALWHVLIADDVRATFKIDLDQVFPQEELVAETGRSAFEHLRTPLWGAKGLDWNGNPVELGMIAGALVNEADIGKGLFTPDVPWPTTSTSTILSPDQWVFLSPLPQALSTEAEMMTRYGADGLDGKAHCLQRVHVTGGATGILIESLRHHRPFTPSFVARAEDQAYLMSAQYAEEGASLRYAHGSGLIMRHDKESFAGEAVEAARIGKMVGNLERILVFTSYARSLPWGIARIKELLDPFTGCFISRVPLTVTFLRMALQAASLFASRGPADNRDAETLLKVSRKRLKDLANRISYDPYPLSSQYWSEREGWNTYYDILDELEEALIQGDQYALDLRRRARKIVEGWKLRLA